MDPHRCSRCPERARIAIVLDVAREIHELLAHEYQPDAVRERWGWIDEIRSAFQREAKARLTRRSNEQA